MNTRRALEADERLFSTLDLRFVTRVSSSAVPPSSLALPFRCNQCVPLFPLFSTALFRRSSTSSLAPLGSSFPRSPVNSYVRSASLL